MTAPGNKFSEQLLQMKIMFQSIKSELSLKITNFGFNLY